MAETSMPVVPKGRYSISPRIVPGLVTRGMRFAATAEEEFVAACWRVSSSCIASAMAFAENKVAAAARVINWRRCTVIPPLFGEGSGQGVSPGYAISLAGHITRFLRGQQYVDRSQLRRLPWTAQGNFPAKIGQLFRELPTAGLKRRPYRTRSYSIHANSLPGNLLRQALRKCHNGGLGRRIVEQNSRWLIRLYRCGVNDSGSRLHMSERGFAEPKHGIHIGLESVVELFRRQVFDVFLGLLGAGDVHQDVDSAQRLHTVLDQLPAEALIADIARRAMGLSTCIFDQRDYFFGIRGFTRQVI